MRKIGLIIISLFFIFSCELKLNEIPEPENVISEEKMALILEDLMIIENQIQTGMPHISQFQKSVKESGDIVLKKHEVTYAQFKKSTEYYGSHQDKMKEIYNAVLESMNKKLTKLQAE